MNDSPRFVIPMHIGQTEADWISRFMNIHGIKTRENVLTALINRYREHTGEQAGALREPQGLIVTRATIGRASKPLTAREISDACGMANVTVRTQIARLVSLGHVVQSSTKTVTAFAAAYTLTLAGKRVYAAQCADPEEKCFAEEEVISMEKKIGIVR